MRKRREVVSFFVCSLGLFFSFSFFFYILPCFRSSSYLIRLLFVHSAFLFVRSFPSFSPLFRFVSFRSSLPISRLPPSFGSAFHSCLYLHPLFFHFTHTHTTLGYIGSASLFLFVDRLGKGKVRRVGLSSTSVSFRARALDERKRGGLINEGHPKRSELLEPHQFGTTTPSLPVPLLDSFRPLLLDDPDPEPDPVELPATASLFCICSLNGKSGPNPPPPPPPPPPRAKGGVEMLADEGVPSKSGTMRATGKQRGLR